MNKPAATQSIAWNNENQGRFGESDPSEAFVDAACFLLEDGHPETAAEIAPATLDRVAEQIPRIACSLDTVGQQARLNDWAELLKRAASPEATGDGVRYSFAAADGLEGRVRDLAAAEQACCSFLEFAVSRTDEQIEMTVTAPANGRDALRFIFR